VGAAHQQADAAAVAARQLVAFLPMVALAGLGAGVQQLEALLEKLARGLRELDGG